MMWVIDTSALIRLFVPDGPLHAELETAFNRAASGADLVLAPHLLLVEVASVLLRKQRRGELSAQKLASFCRRSSRCRSACAITGPCSCRPVPWPTHTA